MDAQTLPQVVMPNHAGFTSPDPRPDVFSVAVDLSVDVPVTESNQPRDRRTEGNGKSTQRSGRRTGLAPCAQ